MSAFSDWVLSKSPINYWRLGEPSGTNADDLGSGANDGTYVGSPTLGVAGGTLDGDTAVELNGSSQYVTTGTSVPANSTRTFACLVRLDNITSYHTIFGDQNDFKVTISNSGNLEVDVLGGNWTSVAVSIVDATFHSVVVMFDQGANSMKVWLDGALIDTQSPSSNTTGVNYRIGNNNSTEYWDGRIDEFAVFTTAWTQTEVDELEAALIEPSEPEPYLRPNARTPGFRGPGVDRRVMTEASSPTRGLLGITPQTLSLEAPVEAVEVDLPLGACDAISDATLLLTAQTEVALAQCDAISDAALVLNAPTQVPLASCDAVSAATLELVAPGQIMAACDAISATSLALEAPTQVPLAACDAVSTNALVLQAATEIPLNPCDAISNTALILETPAGGPVDMPLGPCDATSTNALVLQAATQVPFAASDAVSTTALILAAPSQVPLAPCDAVSTTALALTAPALLALGPCDATSQTFLVLGNPDADVADAERMQTIKRDEWIHQPRVETVP